MIARLTDWLTLLLKTGSESVSKGKYAELNLSSRGFKDYEEKYFKDGAQNSYEAFRDKAAFSRGKSKEDMEEYAQGRVWTGSQAHERGLVDAIGGIEVATEIAKELASIPEDEGVVLSEVKTVKKRTTPLDALRNSSHALAKASKVWAALVKLSEAEGSTLPGYEAKMPGFTVKDGTKDWNT